MFCGCSQPSPDSCFCSPVQIQLFPAYIPYVNGFEEAHDIFIQKSQEKNSPFKAFLDRQAQDFPHHQSLSSYLIMPVQRLPRYKLLLEVTASLLCVISSSPPPVSCSVWWQLCPPLVSQVWLLFVGSPSV